MGKKSSARVSLTSPLVGIVMGSHSDLVIMKEAFDILNEFSIPSEITVVSAHRTPDRMVQYARSAHCRGIKIIIAGAGGAAHLPGMLASFSSLPIIGVPIRSTNSLLGIDSLLSIVQMPPGVPVATVSVNGGKNAGLLAAMLLAVNDQKLSNLIIKYKDAMRSKVESSIDKMKQEGYPNSYDF